MSRCTIGCVLFVGLVVLGVFWAWPNRAGVSEANYRRITAGMSRQEVETILGGPPGDYSTGPVVTTFAPIVNLTRDPWWCCEERDPTWIGNDGKIIVRFGDDGTVHGWRSKPIATFDRNLLRKPGQRNLLELLRKPGTKNLLEDGRGRPPWGSGTPWDPQ
jgi:hypothetical protein